MFSIQQGVPMLFDDPGCPRRIGRGQGVVHCLFDQPFCSEPVTGPDVERGHQLLTRLGAQLVLQQLPEQVVVPVPGPFVVESHQKEAAPLHPLQHGPSSTARRAAVPATIGIEQGVKERDAETPEDGGV